jgi:hypothetical protein
LVGRGSTEEIKDALSYHRLEWLRDVSADGLLDL